MLNPNKISEIKIIIDQFVKDIDSLGESELVSPLKWEELFITTSLIREKLFTLKTEQERLYYKQLISELKENEANFSITPTLETKYVVSQDDPIDSVDPVEVVVSIDKTEPQDELTIKPAGKEQFVIETDDTLTDDSDDGELEFDFTEDFKPVNDTAKSVVPEWMRDIPGPKVEDIHYAVTLNDKLFFIRELFKGDEDQYRLSLQRLNEMTSMKEALEYTRNAFTHWDEESNAVYRFYMLLRRRYNG
ncbi:MAG TPA: hypothetical protein DF637_05955 [Rikenellaceae bacterium]|nr:hypothetical protein [Rikenellaceae bacterium]